MDETMKQEIASLEQTVSDLQYEVGRLTDNEEAINSLSSNIDDNRYNIEQIENDMEDVSNSIQAIPIDEIVNAITELQQVVADLIGEPVGMAFNRIKKVK
jgi:methyl-accepting chemotaxis protein